MVSFSSVVSFANMRNGLCHCIILLIVRPLTWVFLLYTHVKMLRNCLYLQKHAFVSTKVGAVIDLAMIQKYLFL